MNCRVVTRASRASRPDALSTRSSSVPSSWVCSRSSAASETSSPSPSSIETRSRRPPTSSFRWSPHAFVSFFFVQKCPRNTSLRIHWASLSGFESHPRRHLSGSNVQSFLFIISVKSHVIFPHTFIMVLPRSPQLTRHFKISNCNDARVQGRRSWGLGVLTPENM